MFNPFQANVPSLCLLKTPEVPWFSKGLKSKHWPEMGGVGIYSLGK